MPSAVTIKGLPENARPRERLLALGVEALSTSELLAILLRSGARHENALELATRLLAEFGGVGGLASMRVEELARATGHGPFEGGCGRRRVPTGPAFRSSRKEMPAGPPKSGRRWPDHTLRTVRRERTIVAVLDAGHRVSSIVTLTEGSIDRALLPVREVLNAVLRHDGRAFAVAHNHPSGDPEPSEADIEATRALAAAARVVGLRFVDHVIVAENRWRSLRDRSIS